MPLFVDRMLKQLPCVVLECKWRWEGLMSFDNS